MESKNNPLVPQLAQLDLTLEQSNYLTKVKNALPISQDSKVIELKYSAKNFGKMNDTERELSAYQILLKIHTITGWTIPISELMDVLVEQFAKKLNESYANVNEKEVEYAFRNRDNGVKDWGKALNLSMIDEVMIPYLENRFDLSKVEENLLYKPLMIEEKKELTNEEKLEWLNEWKREDINFELIPVIFYDYIIQFNLVDITQKIKWDAIEKSTQQIKSILQVEISESNNKADALKALTEFEKMEKEGFTGKVKDRILTRAKKLIIANYLNGAN